MALDTIFLTATSDARSDETEAEWTAMIRQLIGRVGDNTFSKHLKQAESKVRQRVLDLLHGAQPPPSSDSTSEDCSPRLSGFRVNEVSP